MSSGVILRLASDVALSTQTFNWIVSSMWGDCWHENTHPSRLIVPPGVTRAEFTLFGANISGGTTISTGWDGRFTILRNGTAVVTFRVDNKTWAPCSVTTGMIDVTPGDIFTATVTEVNVSSDTEWQTGNVYFSATTSERAGFVVATIPANNAFNSVSEIQPFSTPIIDTLTTFNGTDGFTVPAGIQAFGISFYTRQTAVQADVLRLQVLINGSSVRTFSTAAISQGTGVSFGPIACSPGQLVQIRVQSPGGQTKTISAADTRLSIDWIANSNSVYVGNSSMYAIIAPVPNTVSINTARTYVIVKP